MLNPPAEQTELTVLGLMSGTSCDGIDAAVVQVTRADRRLSATVLASETTPYSPEIQHLLDNAARMMPLELAEANFLLGGLFAAAARNLLAEPGGEQEAVDLIASHGHTICHDGPNGTLQVGEGAVIAQQTGLPTISDFRTADVAAGGHGAPLVAKVDELLFCPPGSGAAALNIGGIANLTYCPSDADGAIAFDIGPGNSLIDAAVRKISQGASRYDQNGEQAQAGRVNDEVVAQFIEEEPYFQQKPPKTTDREQFGDRALGRLLCIGTFERDVDLVATATAITAQVIAVALGGLGSEVDTVWVSGGGAHNGALLASVQERVNGMKIRPLAHDGFTVDNKEAAVFAVLGALSAWGLPGNAPAATGARCPAILGKLSMPYAENE